MRLNKAGEFLIYDIRLHANNGPENLLNLCGVANLSAMSDSVSPHEVACETAQAQRHLAVTGSKPMKRKAACAGIQTSEASSCVGTLARVPDRHVSTEYGVVPALLSMNMTLLYLIQVCCIL